ncbi:MAG TPA: OPT family oligopeptide transporter [Candidatus Limnocylindrales bacterium]|nr:OPT family oligopeptide transporter [Candidatus Limnocylindrales bacterium]
MSRDTIKQGGDGEASTLPPSAEGPELAIRGFEGTPEEIDRQWLEKVYTGRGDTQKQLTLRAVLMGGALGMLMSLSNLYTTLKLGWLFGVAITACVLSFVIWNLLRALSGGRLSQMTILENNCMQSTASAAGYSTGSTVGTAFGALFLIQGVHQPWYVLGPFVLFTAALGVFVAIPMKRQMINQEQLRFPSGTAAAETLRSLYSKGKEALQKAYALLAALAIGAGVGVLRTYGTLVEQFRNNGHPQVWLENIQKVFYIPESFVFPQWANPISRGHMVGLVFEPSVLLIGAGMITGFRVSISMLLGATILYFGVAPHLLAVDVARAGTAGYVPSFARNAAGDFNPVRWALWGGTAVMVFSSLASVAVQWRTVARAFRIFRGRQSASRSGELVDVEVPLSWLMAGLIPITIGMVLVQYLAFHISVVLGLISVALSFLICLVCARATGETDTTPTGAMGKLTQLVFAVLPGAKGVISSNLMTAGAAASAGTAAADLLTDLKSGYILGANPRKQFLAQLIGVFFGTLSIVPAWYLMVPTKATLESFNPPATNMWKAVADLLTQGIQMLPTSAVWAIALGSVIGVALPVLGKLFPKIEPWLPSAMGLGLSWVVPFQNSLSFAIGASLVVLWNKLHKRTSDLYYIPIASGFVAGESLVAALIAIGCTVVGLLFAK